MLAHMPTVIGQIFVGHRLPPVDLALCNATPEKGCNDNDKQRYPSPAHQRPARNAGERYNQRVVCAMVAMVN